MLLWLDFKATLLVVVDHIDDFRFGYPLPPESWGPQKGAHVHIFLHLDAKPGRGMACVSALEISFALSPLIRFGTPCFRIQSEVPVSVAAIGDPGLDGGAGGGLTLWPPMSLRAWAEGAGLAGSGSLESTSCTSSSLEVTQSTGSSSVGRARACSGKAVA